MSDLAPLKGMRAIVFDVFGTLAVIGERRRPYAQLMHQIKTSGRKPQPDDSARLMSSNVGLAGAAALFSVEIPVGVIAAIERELYAELPTIRLFDEVPQTLTTLREAGYKIGLCSNLAAPYAISIKLLLPFELDTYTWSFEVGAVKPAPAVYEKVCSSLDCAPNEILMIGDTLEADYHGPRRFGMHAFHLCRRDESTVHHSLKTLDEILPMLSR